MAIILDGARCAADLKAELREASRRFFRKPRLAAVLVGDDPASQVYVKNKGRDCDECGFHFEDHILAASVSHLALCELIRQLNEDNRIDGILVQLPLPKTLHEQAVLSVISKEKDVDCFTAGNVGNMVLGSASFLPCTPAGIMHLLRYYEIPISGKHCVIVGRSNIVGKPLAHLMLEADATVTICHSKTENLAQITRQADILVSAVGCAEFVTADMVKPGAVVVDVGMNRNVQGKLCGDVCFEEVEKIASAITPVPGGVGPMTRAMLMANVFKAAQRSQFRNLMPRSAPKSPYPDGDQNIMACPCCGSGEWLHNADEAPMNFCGQCGQAIDWSWEG